ncbi:response regulator receiver and ANTAR domain protein [Williamsia muralis]|uniref:Response regulator receiver and ANTAR domain protein n=1 Tax=Williamsia marianensis TaxID=85044 RepID=A0A495K9Y5_WILMA|nr:GAF and ANTAR domain-containing protein [Williamsia muralis]RKR97448.1 response regulator receiver and ANTAR domain protein [Williamsia muralis]
MLHNDFEGVDHRDLAVALASLAQGVTTSRNVDDALSAVTTAATDLLDGADCADILVISGRKKQFRSYAATSTLPRKMDDLQEQFGQGPCVEVATGSTVVRVDDFSTETRWPQFCQAATDAGVTSMLSFKLYTAPGVIGALNIFGKAVNAFTDRDQEIGLMLATNGAVALQLVTNRTQFESALASRDVIGQAKGMIMERFGIDAVQAFALLTKLSQDSNTPVAHISAQLVEQGPVVTSQPSPLLR